MKINRAASLIIAIMAGLFLIGAVSPLDNAMAADEKKDQPVEEKEKEWFFIDVGLWGGYTGGLTEEYYQVKGNADAIFQFSKIEASIGYARYQHFQITDDAGNYGYADINHIKAEATLTPDEMIELAAGYRYYIGTNSYGAHQCYGGVTLNIDSFTLMGSVDWKQEYYDYNSISFNNKYLYAAGGFGYDITEIVGIEAEYSHNRIDFRSGSFLYYTNLIRFSLYYSPKEELIVSAGIIGGGDSADYTIIGGELSLSWEAIEQLKVNLYTSYSYYAAPSSNDSSKLSKSGMKQGSNPLSSVSMEGESYSSWGVGIGVSYRI